MLEKAATENNLSYTPGNIFNTDESGIQINKKPNSVITEKGSKGVRVLTSGGKSESIMVEVCAYVAIHFLPLLLICKGVNKKHEFGDG
jgi:hypothetical protein